MNSKFHMLANIHFQKYKIMLKSFAKLFEEASDKRG